MAKLTWFNQAFIFTGMILSISASVRADELAYEIEDFRPVTAVDEFLPDWEESPEFFAPETLTRAATRLQNQVEALTRGNGDWSLEFVWIRPKGGSVILSHLNRFETMIPASTVKLFTGWLAFEKKVATQSYIRSMLQHSDNDMANHLLKKVGGRLYLQRTMRETLDLDPPASLSIHDGSGLSPRNRASANHQFRLLRHILRNPKYPVFKKLLAGPGKPGTLRLRLSNHRGKLFAKTGTLPDTGVCALAGFAETPNGTMIFSIIGNDLTRSTSATRRMIDRIVDLNINYLKALKR